jgi:hypothetical protein
MRTGHARHRIQRRRSTGAGEIALEPLAGELLDPFNGRRDMGQGMAQGRVSGRSETTTCGEELALVNTLPGPSGIQMGIFVGYSRAGW